MSASTEGAGNQGVKRYNHSPGAGTATYSSPLIYDFSFHNFSYLWSTAFQEQTILLPTYRWKVNSSLALCHNVYFMHLISSPPVGILSSHILTRGRVSILQQDILRDRDHIHLTFIIVYCYNNYFSLLLATVFNLLLCLIYKLNFISGMYL